MKIISFALMALLGITAGSIAYRLQKSKPILRPEFLSARFTETGCTGRSDRNVLARLLIAKSILWVAVTKDELHVGPLFPFNLMFFPEAFGLDHRVPGKAILQVREIFSTPQGSGVLVKYRHATGVEEILELWVADSASLMRALLAIGARERDVRQ